MGRHDVAVVVLQHEAARPVQDPWSAAGEARRMRAWRDPASAGLDADQAHARIEEAERVAATADARDDDVGKAAEARENLRPRLLPDHRLELTHHQQIR